MLSRRKIYNVHLIEKNYVFVTKKKKMRHEKDGSEILNMFINLSCFFSKKIFMLHIKTDWPNRSLFDILIEWVFDTISKI